MYKQFLNIVIVLGFICSTFASFCPDEKRLVSNGKPISPNGCGPQQTSFFTKVTNDMGNYFGSNFKDCCNEHDVCYGQCNHTQATCDKIFDKCMKNTCDKKNFFSKIACRGMAETFYQLVHKQGKKYYENSIKEQCHCV